MYTITRKRVLHGDFLDLHYFQARKGIHGTVSSSIGTPIPHAKISVEGREHDIYTSEGGDYWRLLLSGRYNVTVSAVGYETLTQTVDVPPYGKNVGDGEVTLDFTLMRDDPLHWYGLFIRNAILKKHTFNCAR